jgi:peptide subunit release factor 1 (eRF1)
MIEPNNLHPLLTLTPGDHPYLTVCLNVAVAHDGHRHYKTFLKAAIARQEKELSHDRTRLPEFQATVGQVNGYLENRLGEETQGIALFAWAPADYFQVYELPVPLDHLFRLAAKPCLLPLARSVTGQSRYCVAAVSLDQARFWAIYLRQITDARRLADEAFLKRVQVGGWSQMRFQRHHEHHVDRFLKDVARELQAFWTSERSEHLILLGHEPALSDFQRELPTALKQRLSLIDNGSPEESQATIMHRLEPLFRGRDEAILQDIRERLAGHYHAVAGIPAVLTALQQGRLGKLALAADLQLRGGQCASCSTLSEAAEGTCTLCGGPVQEVDLLEEIVQESLRQNVHLHFVEQHPHRVELRSHGGLAGVLRF